MNARCYKSFLSSFPLETAMAQPRSPSQPASAVSPDPRSHPALGKTHSTFDFCSWSCEKSTQQKTRRWLILWAHLRGMSHCHGWEVTLDSPLWLWGNQSHPQLLGWGGKVMLCLGYCPSWGSFIFSAVHCYGHAHRLSLNHVLALAIQLHSKDVMRLSLTSEFSFFFRYHILFII